MKAVGGKNHKPFEPFLHPKQQKQAILFVAIKSKQSYKNQMKCHEIMQASMKKIIIGQDQSLSHRVYTSCNPFLLSLEKHPALRPNIKL